MSEQRSRSGLCEGVIRREATETERLVSIKLVGRMYLSEWTFVSNNLDKRSSLSCASVYNDDMDIPYKPEGRHGALMVSFY